MKKLQTIDLTAMDLEPLKERLRKRRLEEADYQCLLAVIETVLLLGAAFRDKCASVKRLLKMIFGSRTEKSKNVLANDPPGQPPDAARVEGDGDSGAADPGGGRPPHKGHGRRKSSDYRGAEHIPVPHEDLKAGDLCPKCKDGPLGLQPPGTVLRFHAQPLITVKVWEPCKLRCGTCGEVFTAELPPEAGDKKYDETVGSMTALVKYDMGMPFNRLGRLQAHLGLPFSPSVQWEIVRLVAVAAAPVYEQLLLEAAQGELFHNDDTSMRILAYMTKGAVTEQEGRTGVFTSGILARRGERQFALFFTGRNHAGENLAAVLQRREEGCPVPIQMSDALSRNVPEGLTVKLANCNSHGRRRFFDLMGVFPEECRPILESYREVYRHEAEAKERKLSAAERLRYHQEHSGPIMDKMQEYLRGLLDDKRVEPNSTIGDAIRYMLNHWEALTLFLREPGAPLDNNPIERMLKVAILNRKNAYFYKTENGAAVGDLLMSLIHTCVLNGVNPFDYLTELQRHAEELKARPGDWMPWNYREALGRLNSS